MLIINCPFILVKIKLNGFFSVWKNLLELNIIYNNDRIKQCHIVEYLGFYLEANLGEKSMTRKSLKKIKYISSSYISYIDKMSF